MVFVMADQQLNDAQAAFQRCIEERDQAGAEQVLDAGYSLLFIHPRPGIVSRAKWLETLPDYVVASYAVEERQQHVDGDVAAVLQRVRMSATVHR